MEMRLFHLPKSLSNNVFTAVKLLYAKIEQGFSENESYQTHGRQRPHRNRQRCEPRQNIDPQYGEKHDGQNNKKTFIGSTLIIHSRRTRQVNPLIVERSKKQEENDVASCVEHKMPSGAYK